MKTSAVGRWRIVEMEQWDQDYVDMDAPGHITFRKGGTGQLHFGCVEVELGWRAEADTGRVEFTFAGFDEGDEVNGRGWAEMQGSRLTGRIAFHQGDGSGFVATQGRK
ncbi:MAG: hypothetical protein HS113_17310 [Verrucomicrobiales bacterium]|nr:hypothetical protein [Verrucomicrobiales bacterium]